MLALLDGHADDAVFAYLVVVAVIPSKHTRKLASRFEKRAHDLRAVLRRASGASGQRR